MRTKLKQTHFGAHTLSTPNLFASYRLGDVTSAGIHFFPWEVTGTQAVLVNAYDLIENPKCSAYRAKLQAEKHTIRKHIDFDGPLMIDSGAYYFIREGKVRISPQRVLEVERESGADIGVVLDHPFPPSEKYKSKRIERTIQNTEVMFAAENAAGRQLELLPVVHGHTKHQITSTIERLGQIASKYNDGCLDKAGIGSLAPLAQNGNKETAVDVLTLVRRILPDAYLHCFSMGSALLMLLALYCGADTVDSQTWIMSAAFKYVQLPGHYVARLATRERAANPTEYRKRLGKLKARVLELYEKEGFVLKEWDNGDVLADPSNEDLDQYISELTDSPGKHRIHSRACHNLWVFNFEARRAREEIKEGRFDQFVESRLKDTKYYNAFLHARDRKREYRIA